jgi:hypothetical protein
MIAKLSQNNQEKYKNNEKAIPKQSPNNLKTIPK